MKLSVGEVKTPGSIAKVLAWNVIVVVCLVEVGLRLWHIVRPPESIEDFERMVRRAGSAREVTLAGDSSLGEVVQVSEHPKRVYELIPNLRARFQGAEIFINSYGMRNPDVAVEKKSGVFRIVGLGDSDMFGWGVEETENYLHILEQLLGTTAPGAQTIEILNFGVPGYNTAMEVATYEHLARHFKPDLILVGLTTNDVNLPAFLLERPTFFGEHRSVLLKALYSLMPTRGGALRNYRLNGRSAEDQSRIRHEYRDMVGIDGMIRAFNRLHTLTRTENIPVVVFSITTDDNLEQTVSEQVSKRLGFAHVTGVPYAREYLRSRGLPDTPEVWQKTFWLSPTDNHPNPFAHRLIAQLLHREFRRHNLVPVVGTHVE